MSADAFYNNGQTSGSLRGTPFVDPSVPDVRDRTAAVAAPPTSGDRETTGGAGEHVDQLLQRWRHAGTDDRRRTHRSRSRARSTGFRVADGNTWWYQDRIRAVERSYYVSADAFYNNGQTSGVLLGTPFVDPRRPDLFRWWRRRRGWECSPG